MRHPVSTSIISCGEFECSDVDLGIVLSIVLPSTPKNTDPCASEDPGCMLMSEAATSSSRVDVSRPWRGMSGIVCKADDGSAQTMIAGPSENYSATLARGMSDGTDAGFCGEMVFREIALPNVSEFYEYLCGTDPAGSREGHDDPAVGKLSDIMFDTLGKFSNLAHDLFEHRREGLDEFTGRNDFAFLGVPCWCATKSAEELSSRFTPRIAVLNQKAGETFFTEPRGAVRRWISTDECESDRTVDGGKNSIGSWPKAVEQTAQLVGQSDPLGDQIIPAAYQYSQCSDIVGDGTERTETVSISAQDVGKHVSVAGVRFAASSGYRGRHALTTLGWIGMIGCPASTKVSISRPVGRSIAIGKSSGAAILRKDARRAARPDASWEISQRAIIWPLSLTKHMAWLTPPQSSPAYKFICKSPLMGVEAPELGDRTDRSLTGALAGKHWRYTLLSVAVSRHLPRDWSHGGRHTASIFGRHGRCSGC